MIKDEPDNRLFFTPAQAWHEGTGIQKAMKDDAYNTRRWIMQEVARLCKEMNAKNTLSTDEEMIFCVRSIYQDHPTLRLEEIRTCFDMVRKGKFGKLYERLKTPEIMDFLRRYESEIRVDIIERQIQDEKHTYNQEARQRIGDSNLKDIINALPKTQHEPVTGHGIGSRLRKQLDELASDEQTEEVLNKYTK